MAMICCCGRPLNGSHDHDTCGPPIDEQAEEEAQAEFALDILHGLALKLCDEWEDRARLQWQLVKSQRVHAVTAAISGEAAMLDGCAAQLRKLLGTFFPAAEGEEEVESEDGH